MNPLLCFYLQHKGWIELIKDILYFAGAYKLISYLFRKNFSDKVATIESNLLFRGRLEKSLNDYVLDKAQNEIKDISIRFVHWKNYPYKFDNDSFKHALYIEYINGKPAISSWINSTGIYFQEPLWYFGNSAYVDKDGIFFFDQKEKTFDGFTEYKDKILRMHLPFSSIVNFDFKEIIEYEPVFYTRHYYRNYNKLYDPIYEIRNRYDKNYFSFTLNRSNELQKYSLIKYRLLQTRNTIISFAKLFRPKKKLFV